MATTGIKQKKLSNGHFAFISHGGASILFARYNDSTLVWDVTEHDAAFDLVPVGNVKKLVQVEAMLAERVGDQTPALVQAVKDHAVMNYNKQGWDVVVECYEDSQIAELIAGCATEEKAIAAVRREVAPYNEQRRAVMAEVF